MSEDFQQERHIDEIKILIHVKILIILWMVVVIFFFLLLAGPEQFWNLAYQAGLWFPLKQLQAYLDPFFRHEIMSIYR